MCYLLVSDIKKKKEDNGIYQQLNLEEKLNLQKICDLVSRNMQMKLKSLTTPFHIATSSPLKRQSYPGKLFNTSVSR